MSRDKLRGRQPGEGLEAKLSTICIIDILKSMISYLERHKHIMDDLTGVTHE